MLCRFGFAESQLGLPGQRFNYACLISANLACKYCSCRSYHQILLLSILWLIIRYLKVGELENHFVLRGGERIKIGRVVFTVRELVNDKYQYYGPDDLETGDSVA